MADPASFSHVDGAAIGPLVAMMDATDRWPAVRAARSWVLGRVPTSSLRPSIDVGSGPGTFGVEAQVAGHRTVDVDLSLAMLRTARARSTAPGVAADAGRLPFGDGVAGLVHCERVLQWTADPAAALAELWRVTGEPGHLAVTDTDWSTLDVEGPEPWVGPALAGAALGWVPHPRLAQSLAERLCDLGATRLEQRTDRAEIDAWDPDDPDQQDGPPGLPLHSIAAGASGPDAGRAADAVRVVAAAARRRGFRARVTLVTVLARR